MFVFARRRSRSWCSREKNIMVAVTVTITVTVAVTITDAVTVTVSVTITVAVTVTIAVTVDARRRIGRRTRSLAGAMQASEQVRLEAPRV